MTESDEFKSAGNGVDLNESPTADFINLDDLLRIVRRRRWTFLGIIGLGVVLLSLMVSAQSPSYRASTTIVVKPPVNPDVAITAAAAPMAATDEMRVATVLEVMRSRGVAEKLATSHSDGISFVNEAPIDVSDVWRNAVKRLNGRWFSSNANSSANADGQKRASDLQRETNAATKMVSVSRNGGSRLINISARAQSREAAAAIANAVPNAYLDIRRHQRERTISEQIGYLRGEYNTTGTELYEAELAVAQYMRDNNLLVPQATSAIEDRIAAVEAALANARNQSATRRLTQLQDEEDELEQKLASLSLVYGIGYPEIIESNRKIVEVREKIEREEEVVKLTMRARRGDLDASAAALSSELRAIRGEHFEALEAGAGLRELELTVSAKSAAFSSVAERLQQAEDALRLIDADIEVFAEASPALASTDYGNMRFLAIGLFGVVMLAGVGALTSEALDNAVRTRGQVKRTMGVHTAGMIPDAGWRRMIGQSIGEMISRKPRDNFSIAIRNLFLEIMSEQSEARPRMVVMCPLSSSSKDTDVIAEGVAHVAEEFDCTARILKLAGKTNLDEGDFPLKRIEQNLEWDRLQEAKQNGFGIMPSSLTVRSDAAGMLVPTRGGGGQKFSEAVQGADLVIIETPSLFESRDAKALAGYVNSVLLMVEWGKTRPSALKAARNIFADVSNVSVVMTRVNYSAHARRGYGDEIEFLHS